MKGKKDAAGEKKREEKKQLQKKAKENRAERYKVGVLQGPTNPYNYRVSRTFV